jgi:hypothetical protein
VPVFGSPFPVRVTPQRPAQFAGWSVSNLIQTPVSPSRYLLWPAPGRGAIMMVLNDILLFACAVTLVTGIVLAAVTLLI